MFRLLIDECLSPELVELARNAGHYQSNHVHWLGKSGTKDPQLMKLIIDEDWTFVTNNSVDFRGDRAEPGGKGLYSRQLVHAGPICLNWPPSLARLEMHRIAFQAVLDELSGRTDLINRCLEVNASMVGHDIVLELIDYGLPIYN